MTRREIPETGVGGQVRGHLGEDFMAQTGRNQRCLTMGDLRDVLCLLRRGHIAARFAHSGFRLRDGMSHKCLLEECDGPKGLAGTGA